MSWSDCNLHCQFVYARPQRLDLASCSKDRGGANDMHLSRPAASRVHLPPPRASAANTNFLEFTLVDVPPHFMQASTLFIAADYAQLFCLLSA